MDKSDWLDRLELELKALQAQTFRAGDPAALKEILLSLCRDSPPEAIAREDRPWLEKLELDIPVYKPPAYRATDGLPPGNGQWKFLQGIAVGITGVDYALADTGTLVLASGQSGGRGLSLAPRHHIALLPLERILLSLDQFLDLYPQGESFLSQGSAVTFISGASRTADIELNLVLGAHGPKELSVIILCFPVGIAG
jgi:L-lactate dehydrogenase complex protein LldG